MNDLLISEISSEDVDVLQAITLIEEAIFEHKVSLDYIHQLTEYCDNEIGKVENTLERAEQLINELYVHQLFIDTKRAVWSASSHQVEKSISYRIIAPILKAVILREIMNGCGFDTDIVFVPEKVMLRLICDDDYAIIFEPVTGESLTWGDLDNRLEEIDTDPQKQYLKAMGNQEIIVRYLSSLKSALIHENQFAKALKCVDIILGLRPDDPFERRDRGFLLHQLDCFKVAYDDYKFFVEQCPKDPAAQLLKIQLENIKLTNTIIH